MSVFKVIYLSKNFLKKGGVMDCEKDVIALSQTFKSGKEQRNPY